MRIRKADVNRHEAKRLRRYNGIKNEGDYCEYLRLRARERKKTDYTVKNPLDKSHHSTAISPCKCSSRDGIYISLLYTRMQGCSKLAVPTQGCIFKMHMHSFAIYFLSAVGVSIWSDFTANTEAHIDAAYARQKNIGDYDIHVNLS